MSAAISITLHAVAGAAERPALARAAALLSATLSDAASTAVQVECVFLASLAELAPLPRPALLIASLLPELERRAEPWEAAAARLGAAYAQAAAQDGLTMFLLTILRAIPRAADAAAADAAAAHGQRLRLARLNLFAAEISRETGCNVIDIDRALADIGAQTLATDCQLGGAYAPEAAARCIASTVLAQGLDDYLPYAAQEAARAAILALPVPWRERLAVPPEMLRRDVMALGSGRRRQRASLVVHAIEENHVAMLLRGVLTRQIDMADAAAKFRRAMGTRGLGATLRALFAGLVMLLRDRVRAVTS